MIDFSKTFCDYHPNQLIMNFCLQQTCLIGLCPNCICTHTQMHVNEKTIPNYQNIRQTYTDVQNKIQFHIESLRQSEQRIKQIQSVIQRKRIVMKQTIGDIKKQCIEAIQEYFNNKEIESLRIIEAEEKKQALHCQNRMQNLLSLITRDISSLISCATDLNSKNFLQSYQRIHTQNLQHSIALAKDIQYQLKKNQAFQTNISYDPSYLKEIRAALKKSITISFKIMEQNLSDKGNYFLLNKVQQYNNRNQIFPIEETIKSIQINLSEKDQNKKQSQQQQKQLKQNFSHNKYNKCQNDQTIKNEQNNQIRVLMGKQNHEMSPISQIKRQFMQNGNKSIQEDIYESQKNKNYIPSVNGTIKQKNQTIKYSKQPIQHAQRDTQFMELNKQHIQENINKQKQLYQQQNPMQLHKQPIKYHKQSVQQQNMSIYRRQQSPLKYQQIKNSIQFPLRVSGVQQNNFLLNQNLNKSKSQILFYPPHSKDSTLSTFSQQMMVNPQLSKKSKRMGLSLIHGSYKPI